MPRHAELTHRRRSNRPAGNLEQQKARSPDGVPPDTVFVEQDCVRNPNTESNPNGNFRKHLEHPEQHRSG